MAEWWKGRCAEIAAEVNRMANPPKEHEVTPWQVEQVLITADAVQRRVQGFVRYERTEQGWETTFHEPKEHA